MYVAMKSCTAKDLFKVQKPQWIFFYIYKFILFYLFLFLAALGLRCCTQALSSCGESGLLFVAGHRLLIAVASLVGSMGSRRAGFSSCGTRAQ